MHITIDKNMKNAYNGVQRMCEVVWVQPGHIVEDTLYGENSNVFER